MQKLIFNVFYSALSISPLLLSLYWFEKSATQNTLFISVNINSCTFDQCQSGCHTLECYLQQILLLRVLNYLNNLSSFNFLVSNIKYHYCNYNKIHFVIISCNIYVVVNFLSQIIFVFLLFFGMLMKLKQRKNKNCQG